MEKTLLSKKELAQRWGISESQVDKLREKGIIEEFTKVGGVKFTISQIHDVEEYEKESVEFKTLRKLEEENKRIKKENKHLKEVIRNQNEILYGNYGD